MLIRFLPVLLLFCSLSLSTDADWLIADHHQPYATILLASDASPTEQWAAQELQHFVSQWALTQLPIATEPTDSMSIILGTPATQPLIAQAYREGQLQLPERLGQEGFEIQTHDASIFVAAHSPVGVLYGTYALLEQLLTQITGLKLVDLDMYVPAVDTLSLPPLHLTDTPFYPIRSALETEDPEWLARHRINMSGAEGVWKGTGVDDGLASAFKYVDAERFESYQDETVDRRRARIAALQERFANLAQRGIRPYLFMYVTGEPTQALVQNHPELLAPPVSYGGSRNLSFYYPLCWKNPQVHELIRDLIQEIVRIYPNLGGLHLRSWGWETRAPDAPECTGADVQKAHWELYETITQAALEVRPDFQFYLSGYDRSWLKDPDGTRLNDLPDGTIVSRKWGLDGEPTPDPGIALVHLQRFAKAGIQLLILSHDTEEAMPFWMLEGDLFVEGVRKYALQPSLQGLGGFTVQGQQAGLSYLDKILSSRLIWDPELDHEQLLENFLATRFGSNAAPHILQALRLNSWTLSSLFRDYAHSLSVTGAYGHGSAGAATRFWQLVGPVPLQDMLSIPDAETAETASHRFSSLLLQQLAAVNEIALAEQQAKPVSTKDLTDLEDTVTLMHIWQSLFESRLKIAEALVLGFQGSTLAEVEQRLASAREYSQILASYIPRIQHFVRVFGYQEEYYRDSLLEEVNGEIALLDGFDANALLHATSFDDTPLQIQEVLNYPNPFADDGTTFFYRLSRAADTVRLSVYTPSGRRLWDSDKLPTEIGDNQFTWDGYNESDERLANGGYLCRLVASLGKEKAEWVGKIAVLR